MVTIDANKQQIKRWLIAIFLSAVFCIQITAQQFSSLYYDNRLSMLFGSIEEYNANYYVSGVTTFEITDTTYYTKALFGKVHENGSLNHVVGIFDSLNHHYSNFRNCLKKTNDGSFIAVGNLSSGGPKVFLLKTDSAGNVLLWHEYADTSLLIFQPQDVVEFSGEGYLISINAEDKNYNSYVIIMRVDALGNIVNKVNYNLNYTELPWLIRPMLNGNFMVGAVTYNYNSNWARTWMIEVDSMGNYINQWIDTSFKNYYPLGMQQTADSGWIMVRQHIAYTAPNYQAYNASIVKLDKYFVREWEIDSGGINDDAGMYDVEILPDGNFICAGANPVNVTQDSVHIYGWIMKISTIGQVLWSRTYLADEHYGTFNYLYDIDVLPNGDLLACGELRFTYNVGITPIQQGWILRTDSNGCVIDNCITGIDDRQQAQDLRQLQIHPNPASSNVQVQMESEMLGGELKVYDIQGKLLLQTTIQTEQIQLNVSSLAKGMYIIIAEKQLQQARGKLVIE